MNDSIDFASLSLMDALDMAILIEEEARERYEEFADQMEVHHTADAARFFKSMAANETKHAEELTARRKSLFGDAPTRMSRSTLWEVEAPDYDKARAFMTPREALAVALDSEIKAEGFFAEALPRVVDPAVQALFKELKEDEVRHQELVKTEMAGLPPESPISAEEFVDEPVAQ